MWKIQLHSDQYAWDFTQGKEVRVEKIMLQHWSMHITALETQPQGSVSTTSCSVDNLAFQLMWHLVWLHTPSRSQTQQSLSKSWENGPSGLMTKWKPFRQQEAKRHKCNYDKKGRAAALEVGDMVLVHVTTFKGRHKMQDRWENREYVVEKWPYPDLPVYVICLRDGEGCSQTLHRNYLPPISFNMGQDETDGSEDRVENNTSPAPAPSVSGSTQSSPDQPAPVRYGIWTTMGQLP